MRLLKGDTSCSSTCASPLELRKDKEKIFTPWPRVVLQLLLLLLLSPQHMRTRMVVFITFASLTHQTVI